MGVSLKTENEECSGGGFAAKGQRLLRFLVLRETPMTSAVSIQFQKAKMRLDWFVS